MTGWDVIPLAGFALVGIIAIWILRPIHAEERLVDRRELARIIGCSEDTVDRMRADGMPSIRWGRRMLRFRPSACIAWLEEQTRSAA